MSTAAAAAVEVCRALLLTADGMNELALLLMPAPGRPPGVGAWLSKPMPGVGSSSDVPPGVPAPLGWLPPPPPAGNIEQDFGLMSIQLITSGKTRHFRIQ